MLKYQSMCFFEYSCQLWLLELLSYCLCFTFSSLTSNWSVWLYGYPLVARGDSRYTCLGWTLTWLRPWSDLSRVSVLMYRERVAADSSDRVGGYLLVFVGCNVRDGSDLALVLNLWVIVQLVCTFPWAIKPEGTFGLPGVWKYGTSETTGHSTQPLHMPSCWGFDCLCVSVLSPYPPCFLLLFFFFLNVSSHLFIKVTMTIKIVVIVKWAWL